jgi:hypothetical protein
MNGRKLPLNCRELPQISVPKCGIAVIPAPLKGGLMEITAELPQRREIRGRITANCRKARP